MPLALVDGQTRILELIARGAPLEHTLTELIRMVEGFSAGAVCGICLFDAAKQRVERSIAPSFPDDFRAEIDGTPFTEPYVAPCAQVAAEKRTIVIRDILENPCWGKSVWAQRVAARGHRQCRSTPIFDADGEVCATFIVLSRMTDEPVIENSRFSEGAAYLASIAIERADAEAVIRDREERLRLAVEGAEMGTWDWDMQSGELAWSDRCRAIFGFSPDEPMSYERFLERVHPEDRSRVDHAVRATLEGLSSYDIEYRIIWPNGQVRWIAAKGSCFFSGSARHQSMRGIALDITARKENEVALAKAEQTLRLAVRATKLGLWDWDPIRNEGAQDERCREIFGGGGLDFESWRECLHPEDRDRAMQVFEAALGPQSTGTFVNEYRIIRPDGQMRWVSGFGAVIFETRDGRRVPVRVVGANLDTTEIKRNERAAEESAARFRFLAESLPHKIFSAGANGETDYLNRQWALYTGLSVEEVLRRGWREFVHPEDLPEKIFRWETAMRDKEAFEFEHRLRNKQGVYRWHLTRAEPLRDGDGEVMMWIGSNTDIHDFKVAHEELRSALAEAEAAREQAELASRAKDQFLAVLSHELRTPLTPVLMAVATIKADPGVTPAMAAALEMIQRNIKLEARLIDDLLDLTRIIRNKLELNRESLDLHSAIRQAVEVCQPEVQEKGHDVELVLTASRHSVLGDSARLQQVFWNLLKNAVKFTPAGGRITIRSRNADDLILVEVEDNGIGIAPEILPRIFEPFEQGDAAFVRQFGGLGLGLAISLATVEAHGGHLNAENTGSGARFVVSLKVGSPDES